MTEIKTHSYKVIPWSNTVPETAFALIYTEDPNEPMQYASAEHKPMIEKLADKLNARVDDAYDYGYRMGMGKGIHDSIEKIQASEDTYTFQFKPGIIEMVDALADATKAYLKMMGITDHMNEIQKKLGFEGPSFAEHMENRDMIRSATVMSAIEYHYKQWKGAGVIK